ncbi:MAG: hypothetical protein IT383_10485 [Deltaproteobacteria bacterium]|nr:hypothetical protein [Deltaproteobacteria bacterium]
MLEETPSGNLNLLRPAKPPVRITKEDVQALTEVFEILERWDREQRGLKAGDGQS